MTNILLKNEDVYELRKPTNFKVDLYPNQLLYANFFREFEQKNKKLNNYIRSCIKDPVGSGKSYAILGFLSLVQESDKKDNIVTHIVVPFKLVKQWEDYINNTDLKYITVNTTKKLNVFFGKKSEYNLVLFSNTFYDKLLMSNENIKPLRIIIDEYNIFDNSFLFNNFIKHIKLVYIINSTIILLDDNFIKYKTHKRNPSDDIQFNIIKKYYKFESEHLHILCTLKVLESNLIKSVDINNFETASEFIDSIFKNKIFSQDALIHELENKMAILSRQNINFQRTTQIKRMMGDIKKNIDNLNKQITHIKEKILIKECLVCFGEIKNKMIIKCCCVVVCDKCASKLTNCVYCEKPFKSFDLDKPILSKIKVLRKDMMFNKNSKIIIFGDYTEIEFDEIKELALHWFPEEYEILTLKGNTNTCNKCLSKFRNNKQIHILYFPCMSDICGFNLEFVTDIILLADLEDAQYKQILGRAYRYGRTCDLIIHSFKRIKI